MFTSAHDEVPRLGFTLPLEIAKSTEQNIWNNVLQSTGYQIAKDSGPWEIQNKWDVYLPSLPPEEKWQAAVHGGGNRVDPSKLEVDEVEFRVQKDLEFKRQSTREERPTWRENSREEYVKKWSKPRKESSERNREKSTSCSPERLSNFPN